MEALLLVLSSNPTMKSLRIQLFAIAIAVLSLATANAQITARGSDSTLHVIKALASNSRTEAEL